MKSLKIIVLLIIFIWPARFFYAQNKWSAAFRPDINFPTEDFGDSKIGTGFSFEVTDAYQFIQHLSIYAGWSYNTFKFEKTEFELDETGYTFRPQFIHPMGTSDSFSYPLRTGSTYNHLELKNAEGDAIDDSSHGFGYQLEVGLKYDLWLTGCYVLQSDIEPYLGILILQVPPPKLI